MVEPAALSESQTAALGLAVSLRGVSKVYGSGVMALANPRPVVAEVLKMAGIDTIIHTLLLPSLTGVHI